MIDNSNQNTFSSSDDSITVVVRIRPLNDREKKLNAKEILSIDGENTQKIWIDSKPESKSFIFDSIINSSVQQDEIFEKIGKPQADFCLKGYNSSIFAYGQTGAGKTFTMLGKQGESRGLQPRIFEYIFSELEKFESSRVKCSYLEIYNEQIMDLLSASGSTLSVREDQKKGVYIEGLSEEKVVCAQQAIELLNTGARNRHVSSTQMNFESSRSHSLFSLTIETKDKDEDGLEKIRCSKFHFVDLAGSERQNLTGAAGQTLKEASNINKSLTVLGCVINSLVEQNQGKQRHIPYRDSKLTFILKDSLGGNSKTCIIAAISDASVSFQETLSTLKFVQRAKMIKNKAQLNEENNITDVRVLRLEIKQLKDKLEAMREQEINFERQLKEQIQGKEDLSDVTILELKERLHKMNLDCIGNEKEFSKNILILKEQQQNEIQKYENILIEMKSELSKQFTSDVQQQIIINSQQIRLKMLLDKTFPNANSHGEKDFQFIKDTEHLLDDFNDLMQIEDDKNQIMPPSSSSDNDSMCIEEQEIKKTPQQRDMFFLSCLNNLIGKIDQSIKSRQDFSEALKNMGLEGEWNTPEKMRVCEQSIDSLREQYSGQLVHSQEQIKQLREDKNQSLQEIQKQRNYISSIEEELNMKNRELSKMDDKYRELCSQRREENHQRETVQMIELEEKIIFLEEEKVKLQRECHRQRLEKESEKLEFNSLLSNYEQLQQQYEITEGKKGIVDEEIKVLNGKIKELEFRELSQQFRLNNMSNELQDFITQNTLMLEEAEKWSKIESTNEELTKKLEELQSENNKFTDQIEVLTESNTYLQSQIDEKSQNNQDFQHDYQKLKDQNQDLHKKNQSLKDQYNKLYQSYENIQIDSSDYSELIEQNKSLFRRCDEYVIEIDSLTKEKDFLKIQVQRKQDQASRFQNKISELQVSQKHFSGALRDAQEKHAQAQVRISNIKVKTKYVKECERFVAEAEVKLHSKEIEIQYLNYIHEEKQYKSNEICAKFNSTLDERDKQQDTITRLIAEKQILLDTNSRLCEANQNLCKEKVNLIGRVNKYEIEYNDLQSKHRGLEETFNNLMLQFQNLQNEYNTLMVNTNKLQQIKTSCKLELEIQLKSEKIADLQNYLDRYASQIRQLDLENSNAKKELDLSQKQIQTNLHTINECYARIDELVELISQFEQHCGSACEIIEKQDFEKQDYIVQIESFKAQILAMNCNIHLTSSSSTSFGRKEIHYVEGKTYSKKARKYKRKLQELQERNSQMIAQYDEQINKMKMSDEEFNNFKKQLEDKDSITKKFQEMSEDLSIRLNNANKKIASQMEHIQYQLKCYEEDKKSFRQDYQKTIINLEKQLDEKSRLVAQKQLRMEYFETLHKQIAETLDKNNVIYNQNLQAVKEKDRKLSYASKLQQEVLRQLLLIINKKPFSKQNDEQLRMALIKVHEFIEQRKFQSDNKENINTLNIQENSSNPITPTTSCNPSTTKFTSTTIINNNNNNSSTSNYIQYTNLNLNSSIVNKEVEEFDKNLDKILFGDETNKLLNTSTDGICQQ